MVFSSLAFLLLFLPISVGCYYVLLKKDRGRFALWGLFLSSLFYYAYWKFENIWIVIASIIVNYFLAKLLIRQVAKWQRKILFIIALIINLGFLAYFKYCDFFIENFNHVFGCHVPLLMVTLPIGISFFTFQQIAYLSDIYTKKFSGKQGGFLDYCLFICFFPQLVAGPIVHHHEMMPQFADKTNQMVNWSNIYGGLILLSLGLAKKVLIADNLSLMVHNAFDALPVLSFVDAMCGMLAYAMQLYFDFSGYSDMAVGCALFFNIKLPFNFDSPYKACSIQEFWRKWHITLSSWLRDYLYIPLGGSRCGELRTLVNLFLTMLLGGLWHGSAWTFVLWGALHGGALVINHIWKGVVRPSLLISKILKPLYWIMTLFFVCYAFMIFRAENFTCVKKFSHALLGQNNFALSQAFQSSIQGTYALELTFFSLVLVLFFKNSDYIYQNKEKKTIFMLSLLCLVCSLISLIFPNNTQEFLYFQF